MLCSQFDSVFFIVVRSKECYKIYAELSKLSKFYSLIVNFVCLAALSQFWSWARFCSLILTFCSELWQGLLECLSKVIFINVSNLKKKARSVFGWRKFTICRFYISENNCSLLYSVTFNTVQSTEKGSRSTGQLNCFNQTWKILFCQTPTTGSLAKIAIELGLKV